MQQTGGLLLAGGSDGSSLIHARALTQQPARPESGQQPEQLLEHDSLLHKFHQLQLHFPESVAEVGSLHVARGTCQRDQVFAVHAQVERRWLMPARCGWKNL